jgi:hypothetical protein
MNIASRTVGRHFFQTKGIFARRKTALYALCIAVFVRGNSGIAGELPTIPSTDVIKSTSCAFESVRDAVAMAHIGQTVMLPRGDCDWGARQLTLPAGVTLKGSGREFTVLRRTAPVPPNTYLVRFDCSNNQRAVFSDISLVGASLPMSEDRGLGLLHGCVDFVVSDSRFSGFVFAGVEVRGPTRQRGVIYNSDFRENYSHVVRNLGYGIVIFGDGSWPNLDLGSENSVFVEDNYFIGNRHHIASNNGARYVFRNNIAVANDFTKDFPQVDAHGLSSLSRGTRSWEIYNNHFSTGPSRGRNLAAIGIRGGDGVIFNNTFTGSIAYPILLSQEGGQCGEYPIKDQIREAYINESGNEIVLSKCPSSVKLNRDYFLGVRAGYKPYRYPHPLRQ